MKHTLKRQLRRLATERPYQLVATSALALALAAGAGAVVTQIDDPAETQTTAVVAELREEPAASRGLARVATAPSSAAPSSAAPSAEPGSAPSSAAASPEAASADPDLAGEEAAPKAPAKKVLSYDYQAQINGWYCGPAAVRNALSAAGIDRDQETLGAALGTTYSGTNSARDTTRVLNAMVKGSPYRTTMIPGGAATPAQMDQLQADVVTAISDGRGVVVNVAGSVTDTAGGWHSFPGGHYVAVVGYEDEGRMVKIADSADPSYYSYWLSTIDLANWAATRGYSS